MHIWHGICLLREAHQGRSPRSARFNFRPGLFGFQSFISLGRLLVDWGWTFCLARWHPWTATFICTCVDSLVALIPDCGVHRKIRSVIPKQHLSRHRHDDRGQGTSLISQGAERGDRREEQSGPGNLFWTLKALRCRFLAAGGRIFGPPPPRSDNNSPIMLDTG
jgi:hypothetical protein